MSNAKFSRTASWPSAMLDWKRSKRHTKQYMAIRWPFRKLNEPEPESPDSDTEASPELQRRVRDAVNKGGRELNLSRLGLTRVPEVSDLVPQLEFLDISHNQLAALPEWL